MQENDPSGSQVLVAHRQVRSAIISGALPAGALINQVEISRQLSISRTPVREALRMLQSEGLLEAQHQQRMRVAPIRPAEVDAVYSERILLEALAISMTAERASPELKLSILRTFREMDENSSLTLDEWEIKHNAYHRQLTACASVGLQETLARYADRAERFRRVFITSVPRALEVSAKEHASILEAVLDGAPAAAMHRLAHHFARTALTLLSTIEPQFDPIFIRRALTLVCNDEAAASSDAKPSKSSKPGKSSKASRSTLSQGGSFGAQISLAPSGEARPFLAE